MFCVNVLAGQQFFNRSFLQDVLKPMKWQGKKYKHTVRCQKGNNSIKISIFKKVHKLSGSKTFMD